VTIRSINTSGLGVRMPQQDCYPQGFPSHNHHKVGFLCLHCTTPNTNNEGIEGATARVASHSPGMQLPAPDRAVGINHMELSRFSVARRFQ